MYERQETEKDDHLLSQEMLKTNRGCLRTGSLILIVNVTGERKGVHQFFA